MKAVLTIGLAVAQCLSWGAPAIYLCICRSGGICIDAGPGDCRCAKRCASEHGETCCGHDADSEPGEGTCCGHLAPPSQCTASPVVDEPRGCTHIQISWSQPPSVSAFSSLVDFRGSRAADDALFSPGESPGLIGSGILSDNNSTARESFAAGCFCHVNPANLRC